MIYIKQNKNLQVAKIIAVLLQAFATIRVFFSIFKDAQYPLVLQYILAALSVALIDYLFLTVLSILEHPEMSARDKLPWVCISIPLLISILAIGFVDENLNPLSFAPRLGLVGIVMADLFVWINQWHEEHYSRDAIEKRIRDAQVIMRNQARQKAEQEAWNILAPDLLERAKVQAWDSMGMDGVVDRWREIEDYKAAPKICTSKPAVLNAEKTREPLQLNDGIISLGDGKYAWIDEKGKKRTKTATGKPYSYKGAHIAQARYLNNN